LVYQLEKAFWPTLQASESTAVWNGVERPPEAVLDSVDNLFVCIDTLAPAVTRGFDASKFDIVLIDECHHAGAPVYREVIEEMRAGKAGGPFLLGLTATPWRPDGKNVEDMFGQTLVSVDLVSGMRRGFLAEVDYRMYTDNVEWERLAKLKGKVFSPRGINRTLFIQEWDDAVVFALRSVWEEQPNPRAIVFCGNIDHAMRMKDRINALSFANAEAIHSGGGPGRIMTPWERNRVLADFEAGAVNVVCAVDIFNEGVDVPDVNIVVFQRVTHSRRIFVQQLGRGLRLSPGKQKTIVLDFVSDIRRFAAGLELKDSLNARSGGRRPDGSVVSIHNRVTFTRSTGDDADSELFLREWLEDVAEVEEAGEDAMVLKYPPAFPSSMR
jgi:superfamily II DNA or RNA helicase